MSKRFDGIPADSGDVKWAENANVGVMPQDNTELFAKDETLMEWMSTWRNTGDDDQVVRGTLGRLLFSGDEIGKSVKVLSGGEKVRCMLAKMMLSGANVLLLDGPTNHLDLESIQAVNEAIVKFKGTVIFTSHDHEFIQTSATRIIELDLGVKDDREMTYDEYIAMSAKH